MDFGLLAPEVNSGRMYAGPGSGSMLAAAAAWDGLSDQLYRTASSYSSTVSGLAAEWRGPSSATMAAAAAPYTAWMSDMAARAEGTALQARAAAAAYETAFAATVPPASVATNRAQLTALAATNFFGQNTLAIMANEVDYVEMWARDAAAMYGYAGSVAAASQVTPFDPPPQTTNPAGTAGQATAVGAAAGTHADGLTQAILATPHALHQLASPNTPAMSLGASTSDPSSSLPSTLQAIDNFLTGPFSPPRLYELPAVAELLGGQGYLLPQAEANLLAALDKTSTLPAGAGGELLAGGLGPETRVVGSVGESGISVSVGHADLIGRMSVPHAWTSSQHAVRTVAAIAPHSGPAGVAAADGQGSPLGDVVSSGLLTREVTGTGRSATQTAGVGSLGGAAAAGQSVAIAEASAVSNIFVIPEDGGEVQ